ncbi:MAG: asparaginase domain-containing protein [Synergistales bacterium]|nr:asparaginase domain-containing protein [Synergistales bacterium]
MNRVLAILTGGTIGSALHGSGAGPDSKTAGELEGMLRAFYGDRHLQVDVCEPWPPPGRDSSDLGPEEWIRLTEVILRAMEKGDLQGVLILHGTDTMAYTAAWLSVALEGIPIPVVLTGSQLTLDYTPEDVQVNLRGAAQVLCSSFPGVWVYFNWKLYSGRKVHKARAIHPDAFVPVGGIPLYFSPEWARQQEPRALERLQWEAPAATARIVAQDAPEAARRGRRLRWHFCTPGNPLEPTGEEEILGLIGFGSGNAPQHILRAVGEAFQGGDRPIILACSQAEGDVKNPAAYSDVGIATLAEKGFPVFGQRDYPLEFVHALAWYALCGAPDTPGELMKRYLPRYEK